MIGGLALSRYRRAKIERRRRGGRANAARCERADPAFARWRGARARRRRFAGDWPLDLPWAEGPRLWRAEDIAAHLPLFKDYAPTAGLLAKAGAWDESKHPRWPGGFPIIKAGGSIMAKAALPAKASRRRPGIGHNAGPPLHPPKFRQWTRVPKSCAMPLLSLPRGGAGACLGQPEFGPAGEYLTLLEAAAETALWLYDKCPYIKADLDDPRSLEELQSDLESVKGTMFTILWSRPRPTARTSTKGYRWARQSRPYPDPKALGNYGVVYERQQTIRRPNASRISAWERLG